MSTPAVTDRMPDLSAGLCRNRLDEFWDINTATASRAMQVCNSGCPVFDICRDWGLRHEQYGCWGGLAGPALAIERRRLGIELVELRPGELAPRAVRSRASR